MLFDPPAGLIDLPAALVELSDGRCRKGGVVGQEYEPLPLLSVEEWIRRSRSDSLGGCRSRRVGRADRSTRRSSDRPAGNRDSGTINSLWCGSRKRRGPDEGDRAARSRDTPTTMWMAPASTTKALRILTSCMVPGVMSKTAGTLPRRSSSAWSFAAASVCGMSPKETRRGRGRSSWSQRRTPPRTTRYQRGRRYTGAGLW